MKSDSPDHQRTVWYLQNNGNSFITQRNSNL